MARRFGSLEVAGFGIVSKRFRLRGSIAAPGYWSKHSAFVLISPPSAEHAEVPQRRMQIRSLPPEVDIDREVLKTLDSV
jgi:hypothetical protein